MGQANELPSREQMRQVQDIVGNYRQRANGTHMYPIVSQGPQDAAARTHTIFDNGFVPDYQPLEHVVQGEREPEVRQGRQGTNQRYQVDIFRSGLQLCRGEPLFIFPQGQQRSNLATPIQMHMRIDPRLVLLDQQRQYSPELMKHARLCLSFFIRFQESYIVYRAHRLRPHDPQSINAAEDLQRKIETDLLEVESALLNMCFHTPADARPSGLGLLAICFGRWTSDEADHEGNYQFLAATEREQPLSAGSRFDTQRQDF